MLNFFSRKKIYFVYAKEYVGTGSTVMRGEQLSMIAKRFLNDFEIHYASTENDYRNSILFLTKNVLKISTAIELSAMKKKNNILIFDPVDAKVSHEIAKYADVIVAASRTAFDDYESRFAEQSIKIVDHHVDPRIKLLGWKKRPSIFRAAYFGELANTYTSRAIENEIDFIQVDTFRQRDDWLNMLPNYNFHYAIRQSRNIDHHKPFLKGFTAAHCGANIIIQESETEATRWLGHDYPYLIKGKVTERVIIDTLERAKKDFGLEDWERGLKKMREIKKNTSEIVIGRQLKDLFVTVAK